MDLPTSKSAIGAPPTLFRAPDLARPRLALSPAEHRFILGILDLLMLNAALLAAVVIWNGFSLSLVAILATAKWFVTLSVLWLLVGSVLDLFDLARAASSSAILPNAAIAVGLAVAIYVAVPWLTPPILSRSYVFGFAAMSVAGILGWRVFYARVGAQPDFRQRAILLGAGQAGDRLAEDIRAAGDAPKATPFRGTGYQIVGYVASDGPASDRASPVPWLGPSTHLVQIARSLGVDEVIVAEDLTCLLEPELFEIILDCQELGIRVNSLSDVYQRLTTRCPVQYAHRDPTVLFSVPDWPAWRLYGAAKRLLDVAVALVGLACLAILAPCVALANAIGSPGALFYRQERVGLGGKPFVLFKLRSMVPDAEQDTGAVWSGDGDARITPVGRWLRKTRLDELPQFINVLRGEMSVIGPRPERPEFVGELARQMPIYRVRHAVKPGVTGWAQTRYRYGSSVEDARIKLEYDLYYIKHRSMYLDLLIMLQTIPVVLGLKGQ